MNIKVLSGARRRDDEGAAAVEFAILVIPLVLIVFGVIHFGLVFAQQNSLNNAVRSAARYGSVNLYVTDSTGPHNCAQTISRAREAADTLAMDGDNVTVTMKVGSSPDSASPVCDDSAVLSSSAPCDDSDSAATLFVVAEFKSKTIGVPFVGIDDERDLKSVGAYKCEYS